MQIGKATGFMLGLLFIFVATGCLFVGLSIPLIRQKIPPNQWYGFRIPATLKNRDVWYQANVYSSWRLLWVGVATVIVSILTYFVPGIGPLAYVVVVLGVMMGGIAVAVMQSFWFVQRMTTRKSQAESGFGDTNSAEE